LLHKASTSYLAQWGSEAILPQVLKNIHRAGLKRSELISRIFCFFSKAFQQSPLQPRTFVVLEPIVKGWKRVIRTLTAFVGLSLPDLVQEGNLGLMRARELQGNPS
jgi:hypothetical protein